MQPIIHWKCCYYAGGRHVCLRQKNSRSSHYRGSDGRAGGGLFSGRAGGSSSGRGGRRASGGFCIGISAISSGRGAGPRRRRAETAGGVGRGLSGRFWGRGTHFAAKNGRCRTDGRGGHCLVIRGAVSSSTAVSWADSLTMAIPCRLRTAVCAAIYCTRVSAAVGLEIVVFYSIICSATAVWDGSGRGCGMVCRSVRGRGALCRRRTETSGSGCLHLPDCHGGCRGAGSGNRGQGHWAGSVLCRAGRRAGSGNAASTAMARSSIGLVIRCWAAAAAGCHSLATAVLKRVRGFSALGRGHRCLTSSRSATAIGGRPSAQANFLSAYSVSVAKKSRDYVGVWRAVPLPNCLTAS